MSKINTRSWTFRLVFSAMMIAIGTVLSLFSFSGLWVYGGGVTFCSMLPLVILSYMYGTPWGLFSSLVYALLQMVLGFNNVLYGPNLFMMILIALLDYVLAFTAVGLSGVFKNKTNWTKNKELNSAIGVVLGIVLGLGLRFVCHFISGWAIWEALWPNELGMASWWYSIVYNGSYMLPEILITAVVAVILNRIIDFSTMKVKKAKA